MTRVFHERIAPSAYFILSIFVADEDAGGRARLDAGAHFIPSELCP